MNNKGHSCTFYRILIIFAVLSPFVSTAFAQDVKIKINAPETVMIGEQFRVNYTIESSVEIQEAIIFRNMDGFSILYGPSVSSNRSVSFEKGQRVSVYTYTSSYFLEALKEGKLSLPRAEISFKGKNYKSDSFKIEVKSPDKYIGEVDAFIKTIVSKEKVNLSDTLTLTYKLYTSKEINKLISTDFPTIKDFYRTNITNSRQRFRDEEINGKKYKVVVLRKLILQPQEIGQKTIPEGQVIVEYATPTGRKVRDMWGDVYEEAVKNEKTLIIEPVTIRVQDLKSI